MNVLDLFSGIGGFSVGLERVGFRTVQFVEINPDCRRRLREHWPSVQIHGDIHTYTPPCGVAEVVCGGFPCQPFSTAARGRNNARDLWPEFLRVVGAVRPSWVIAENVPGIGHGGIDRVCGDFEDAGYACWAFDLDTALPTRQRGRHRILWLAHAHRESQSRRTEHAQMARLRPLSGRRDAHDPAPLGVDDGLCCRMDRLRMLGNAATPELGELAGRAIMRATVNGNEQ